MRTHTCGELTGKESGKTVELSGWVHKRRDHGGVIFIDLRDRYGITQIVFNPKHNEKLYDIAYGLNREDVITITGKVKKRISGMTNKDMITGEIEVFADTLDIITRADPLPMEIEGVESTDETRLKYRYIDLRKPAMQKHLLVRHKAAQAARDYFDKHSFLEVETPLLVRSTPEGARDYVVPSRVHKGKFYALPQSPQIYKQILMISGVDRYYQFARCLRDEDLREDRQPEHTQIDLEMSFVTSQEVRDTVEGLYKYMFKKVLGKTFSQFPVFSYEEAMNRFGTDKPDIRFSLELTDISSIVKDSEFSVFSGTVKKKGVVKCIAPEKEFSRKEIDALTKMSQELGAKGLAIVKVTDKLEGGISKFLDAPTQRKILSATKAKKGSTLLFVADKEKTANVVLSKLRNHLGKELELYDPSEFAFCWIIDFPLFEYNDDEKRWEASHHIFTMPKKECVDFLEKDPSQVIADLYDLVLNGVELGSGSIRCSDPSIQERIMKVIGLSKENAYKKFGFLLEAYKYGSPVHGGIGLGFDRVVALMTGNSDIREVIAFPKNKNAECPMDGSPNTIDPEQKKELGI